MVSRSMQPWRRTSSSPEVRITSQVAPHYATYNADGLVATKNDAKGQQAQYTYHNYKRLTQVKPYAWGIEDPNQRTD